MTDRESFDAIVVGTGFGGAVAAWRLAEAGKDVCVLERGRRYERTDFPRISRDGGGNPDLARWAWNHDHGLWDFGDFGGVQVVRAAGYGGGSLIYANVHLRAPADVFKSSGWPFTRAELDPYYDRAAAMLGVMQAPAEPDKTAAFAVAAKELGRASELVRPPLAVHFRDLAEEDEWRDNGHGRSQQACNHCGDCDIGCTRGAKNTLDLNYLAHVDDSAHAFVRTRAEVVGIERLQSEDALRWRVRYVDWLTDGSERTVTADSVFLCAGAIGSTELLLANPDIFTDDIARKQVGKGYYANADGLAMVYDTTAPMAPEKRRGPVITSSITYDDGEDWFLVQDGGHPRSMNLAFGAFRAGALMDRNKLTSTLHSKPMPKPSEAAKTAEAARTWVLDTLKSTPVPPPEAAGLTDQVVSVFDDDSPERDKLVERLGFGAPNNDPVPPQLRHLVWSLRRYLVTLRDAHMRDIVVATVDDHWLRRLANRYVGLTRIFGRDMGRFRRWMANTAHSVMKRLRRLLVREQPLVDSSWAAVQGQYFGASDQWFQRLWPTVRWAMFRAPPDAHTAMLLTMGRDKGVGGRIELRDDRLSIEWPRFDNMTLYGKQERMMRDLATRFGGELRTNPAWALGKRPISAHSQGGCALGQVTDDNAQVKSCPGLYVLDGSLFPSAVGVNPSATIAAVAEYMMTRFLNTERPGALPVPAHAAPPPDKDHKPPKSEPIGLQFRERLRGHATRGAGGVRRRRTSASALSLRLDLTATAPDFNRFLASNDHILRVEGLGVLRGRGLNAGNQFKVTVAGTIGLLVKGADQAAHTLLMTYNLTLSGEAGDWTLSGRKTLRDDPGFDAWTDTTTIFFDLVHQEDEQAYTGCLRVHIGDFIRTQLPSLKVTGLSAGQDAYAGWTLAQFARFFFANISRVYSRRLPARREDE
ncbi:MAG: choline dehydrogenase-like flavoprotein [Myxococcota bacterium]|jgi:choline dehydrogenase-like flavoprotein